MARHLQAADGRASFGYLAKITIVLANDQQVSNSRGSLHQKYMKGGLDHSVNCMRWLSGLSNFFYEFKNTYIYISPHQHVEFITY